LEPVHHKEKDLADEDEEQGPGDVNRAGFKPESEPLQAEDHDPEQFVQVSPPGPLDPFVGIVQQAANV
jgi:hypothetical protein